MTNILYFFKRFIYLMLLIYKHARQYLSLIYILQLIPSFIFVHVSLFNQQILITKA